MPPVMPTPTVHKHAQADVPAAAQQLFASGGFPTDPSADWSGVSLLNQPGANTWPITAMPCIYARPDQADRGSSGQLVVAFLTFMLSASAQARARSQKHFQFFVSLLIRVIVFLLRASQAF